MNQNTESLWSPEIKPGILSPRDILDMQAVALREQTGGTLNADVRTAQDQSEDASYVIFDVVAPTLGSARHRILTARYFAERIYPCHVDADGLRAAEVANSDEEFRELVRQVLNSGEVKALCQSLISRSGEIHRNGSAGITRKHAGHKRLFRPALNAMESDDELNGSVEALYEEAVGGD
jgi:hypothetical protein